MNSSQFVLFPLGIGWRVAIVGDAVSFEDAESPADIANVISRHGGSKRVWIALPSKECLCATVSSAGLARGPTNESLKYRLEEIFPWAAEDFAVATSAPSDGEVFAVAIRQRELDDRVEALSNVGIVVAGVSPAALLAAANVFDGNSNTILLDDGSPNRFNWIRLRDRMPIAWNLIGNDPQELQSRLAPDDAIPLRRSESMSTLAATEAARILTRQAHTPINFLSVRSARPRAMLSAVACAAILLGLCAGFTWRTANYHRAAALSDDATRAIFSHLFPGSPVPAGVVSRLVGQARSMRAAADVVGDGPQQSKALSPTLASVLNSLGTLPPTVRFAIDDLMLDGHHLSITGQAVSLGDAQSIADALHSLNGWTVEPPRTEQRLAAVNFTIQASTDSVVHQAVAAGGVSP